MNCINEIVISNIKKIKKKYVIKTVITAFLFCLSIILLFLLTNREYEQLFIFLFFIVFTFLLNLILYFILEHINKYTYKINLYCDILHSNNNKIKAKVIEDMHLETYSRVVFRAYRIIDTKSKSYRILIPEEYNLEVTKMYEFTLSRNVVINYEEC